MSKTITYDPNWQETYKLQVLTAAEAVKKIRPGQRVPYRKGNRREIAKRRDYVARLLAGGTRKMEIHRLIKNQFNRQWRTADRDIQFVTRAGYNDGVSLHPKRA